MKKDIIKDGKIMMDKIEEEPKEETKDITKLKSQKKTKKSKD